MSKYVIITPAHNEEVSIRQTIAAVAAQSVQPSRWVIVNDGSTDGTQDVIRSWPNEDGRIVMLNIQRSGGRSFARKAMAFREGVEAVRDLDYEYVAALDADILLPKDFYERLLNEFALDPRLGIAGGSVGQMQEDRFVTSDLTVDSVGGAVQTFRRKCFEEVGGYLPLRYGGIDAAAEIKAKMLGWKVRKLLDLKVVQQRETGSAEASGLKIKFREGIRFHSLGYGLLLYFLRCLRRLPDPPVAIGSVVSFCGYVHGLTMGHQVQIDPALAAYWRQEHWARLWRKGRSSD